jgi:hypothetical protein
MGCSSSNQMEVLVFMGSLRKNSNNKGLIEALINSPEFKELGISVHTPNLEAIPFFNEDYDKEKSNDFKFIVFRNSRNCCGIEKIMWKSSPFDFCHS